MSVAVKPRSTVYREIVKWLTAGEDLRRGQEYQEVGGGRELAAGRLHVAQPLQGVLHLCRPGEESGKRTREGNKENNLLVLEKISRLPAHYSFIILLQSNWLSLRVSYHLLYLWSTEEWRLVVLPLTIVTTLRARQDIDRPVRMPRHARTCRTHRPLSFARGNSSCRKMAVVSGRQRTRRIASWTLSTMIHFSSARNSAPQFDLSQFFLAVAHPATQYFTFPLGSSSMRRSYVSHCFRFSNFTSL